MEPIQPAKSTEVVLTPPPPALMEKPTLESLVKHDVISPDGANWLIEVSDPFHDKPIMLAGYPDINMGNSVVQCVKQSQSISVPSSITTGTWDVNIVLWPKVDYNDHVSQWNSGTNYLTWSAATTSTVATYAVGGLTALAGVSGATLYGNSTQSNITDLSTLSLPDSYLQGNCRIIGMGFEVVNTTSLLNIQGMVTTWRQPTPTLDNSTVAFMTNTSTTAPEQLFMTTQPPGTLAQATLLAGSKQWPAKDGCYVIASMNDTVNRVSQPRPIAYLSLTGDVTLGGNDVGIGQGTSSTGTAQSVSMLAPFHMSGAYFTGLSLATTLQLNVNYYIERFPTPFESDLVVLARPSSAYDPLALEAYCRALNDMPTGVPQGMNPLGEWFANVLRDVSAIAQPVLKSLAPVVPGAGVALQVAKGVNAVLGKSKPKPQPRRQRQANAAGGPTISRPTPPRGPRRGRRVAQAAQRRGVPASAMYGDW